MISWNKSIETSIISAKSKLKLFSWTKVSRSKQNFSFRIWILSPQRTSNKKYYLPNVEVKGYNVMTDGKNFFNQPIKSNKVTYENIRKIATGKDDYYTTGCLLDYIYFRNYYKMIAADLRK